MILQIYTVLDKAVSAYLPPFFCRSDAEAVRSFRDAVNKQDHQFHLHADDYVLYRVGAFDDALGLLESLDSPDRIIHGTAVLVDRA